MEEQVIINKTIRACSKEFGPSGNRIKLYFEDAEDLDKQIKELKDRSLWIE